MKTKLCLWVAAAFLVSSAALFADDHKEEGKIVRIDPDSKMIVVQTEKGDQSRLYWTETTKLEVSPSPSCGPATRSSTTSWTRMARST